MKKEKDFGAPVTIPRSGNGYTPADDAGKVTAKSTVHKGKDLRSGK